MTVPQDAPPHTRGVPTTQPISASDDVSGGGSETAITLEGVTKVFPRQKRPAVSGLSLDIPAGQTVMFVGPSGCGKTTSLKMINRLIEPTSGRITIGGEDIAGKNPTQLRRKIGYVIQGGGMMPHMTVGGNVGLVPGLLKWDKKRIAERVDKLLDLVGLDPMVYRDRYPRELSGGQQQRVGVARGLAADPPVVLMDEPFGAVDPITRSRLQDEMLDIQDKLGKTVVCVTHDIDEAIKLGDRIAIFREGAEVVQYDTPENILANPADEFVEDFIGSGATLKQLRLRRVDDLELTHPVTAEVGEGAAAVVERIRRAGEDSAVILDALGRPREWLSLRQLRRHRQVPAPENPPQTIVDVRSTLNDALDSMLASSHGGALVTRHGKYVGVLPYETVTGFVRTLNEEAGAA